MSPYEIAVPGGSVEHWNTDPGCAWITRLTQHWRRSAWLNPSPAESWGHTRRSGWCAKLMEDRMFPLTAGRAGRDGPGCWCTEARAGRLKPQMLGMTMPRRHGTSQNSPATERTGWKPVRR